MRLQSQATGTAHARLPSGNHGPSRCHLSTLPIAPHVALTAVGRRPNSSSIRPRPVGHSRCVALKLNSSPGAVPVGTGTGTGVGHSDPVDPVTRWDNLGSGKRSAIGGPSLPKAVCDSATAWQTPSGQYWRLGPSVSPCPCASTGTTRRTHPLPSASAAAAQTARAWPASFK
jgi:hypothetical protein